MACSEEEGAIDSGDEFCPGCDMAFFFFGVVREELPVFSLSGLDVVDWVWFGEASWAPGEGLVTY